MDGFDFVILIMGILVLTILVVYSMDELFVKPIAKDNANEHCKALGFDQFKEMSRVGIFSINPVAIKCEYAERYTDLGVRANAP